MANRNTPQRQSAHPSSPIGLRYRNHKHLAIAESNDAELLEALSRAKEELGLDHPLVKSALRSLRAKERIRLHVNGFEVDDLNVVISQGRREQCRENDVAAAFTRVLGENPLREVQIPGFHGRVDMYFKERRLVVEEQGVHHRKQSGAQKRDALMRSAVASAGLKLIEVWPEDAIDDEAIRVMLDGIGVSI